MGRPQNYYVVNAGRGRSATHIMQSRTPSTPNPASPGSILAQLLWFGGNAKPTLCGLPAARHVNVFTPGEASCRECRRRWELATKAADTRKPSGPPASKRYQLSRVPYQWTPGKPGFMPLGHFATEAKAQAAATRDAGSLLSDWHRPPDMPGGTYATAATPPHGSGASYNILDLASIEDQAMALAQGTGPRQLPDPPLGPYRAFREDVPAGAQHGPVTTLGHFATEAEAKAAATRDAAGPLCWHTTDPDPASPWAGPSPTYANIPRGDGSRACYFTVHRDAKAGTAS
jgi:hypothetical protein